MKCVMGIDLGSTTTKAVMLDESGRIVGKGITNSRSNYEVACAVARIDALTSARIQMLERAIVDETKDEVVAATWVPILRDSLRLELFLSELGDLRATIMGYLKRSLLQRGDIETAVRQVLDVMEQSAPPLFAPGAPRRSDFFRDIAGASFVAEAENVSKKTGIPFEQLAALYDRAILEVETRVQSVDMVNLFSGAMTRVAKSENAPDANVRTALEKAVESVISQPIEELSVVGTGYGRQTLPFPREATRSEILCHGRGAHRVFPGTRTVLDIGGQDTKAIQVDENGVVTSFQMNDRCAAGCGRYLGYIADELNLGLHELGPLALGAKRVVKVNSTCTVFAGAELRERLALGQKREDILAGLHRSIMLRAMSLLARSGGVKTEFTFTGGVCNNQMATKVLRELVDENYGVGIQLNISPDSIYMGALGAAMFALDDVKAGKSALLPSFVRPVTTAAEALS